MKKYEHFSDLTVIGDSGVMNLQAVDNTPYYARFVTITGWLEADPERELSATIVVTRFPHDSHAGTVVLGKNAESLASGALLYAETSDDWWYGMNGHKHADRASTRKQTDALIVDMVNRSITVATAR